jgi:hypothetical protein
MKTLRIILVVGMMIAATLLAIGCNGAPVPVPLPENGPFKVTGGGWMNSAACGSDSCKLKATFGFNLHYEPNETGPPTIKGQLQYTDHGGWNDYEKVRFHGVVTDLPLPPFGMAYEGTYEGDYRPQPKTLGPGGRFVVTVEDIGQPGASTSDSIEITLSGGVFDGYSNAGNLKGGNIKLHEDEDED